MRHRHPEPQRRRNKDAGFGMFETKEPPACFGKTPCFVPDRAVVEPEGRLKVATGASPWFGGRNGWSPIGSIDRFNCPSGTPRRIGIVPSPGLAPGVAVNRPTGSSGPSNPADGSDSQAIGPSKLRSCRRTHPRRNPKSALVERSPDSSVSLRLCVAPCSHRPAVAEPRNPQDRGFPAADAMHSSLDPSNGS